MEREERENKRNCYANQIKAASVSGPSQPLLPLRLQIKMLPSPKCVPVDSDDDGDDEITMLL